MRNMSLDDLHKIYEDVMSFVSPKKYDKPYLDMEQYKKLVRALHLLFDNLQYFSKVELDPDIRVPYESHQILLYFKYDSVDACDINNEFFKELIECNGDDEVIMSPDGMTLTYNLYKPSK